MPKLLIADDEPNVLFALSESLCFDDLSIVTARTGAQAIEAARSEKPDVVILDVRLPDMSGLQVFDKIREQDRHVPVIMITAYSSTETAIEAMKYGAFEYLLKPLDFTRLHDVVREACEASRLRHVPAVFDVTDVTSDEVDQIIGRSPLMQDVYKGIGRVARQNVNVLILGESGTGKELVARSIFYHSQRNTAPFISINCAAIPDTLLESELFGHERGAFTGADRRRIGRFEQADGGTIFLDEIGDMSPATQAKVLRLLQEQKFERLGGNETIHTDVRIIAATNQDLESMVNAGRFRQDLYYRLKVFVIQLPPLRDRMEDLPALVQYFIDRSNKELGRQIRSVSEQALELLSTYKWPGNIRELQSVVKSAVVQGTGDVLMPPVFAAILRQSHSPDVALRAEESLTVSEPVLTRSEPAAELRRNIAEFVRELLVSGEADIYRRVVGAVDEVVLRTVLEEVRGNQVRAADLLGISRTTLRAKLRPSEAALSRPASMLAHDQVPAHGVQNLSSMSSS